MTTPMFVDDLIRPYERKEKLIVGKQLQVGDAAAGAGAGVGVGVGVAQQQEGGRARMYHGVQRDTQHAQRERTTLLLLLLLLLLVSK